jgi:hypothetical protein
MVIKKVKSINPLKRESDLVFPELWRKQAIVY